MADYFPDGVEHLKDLTEDDSDKVFTPAASLGHRLLWGFIEYVSTATVGNRQVILEVRDENDVQVLRVDAGVTQAASLTHRYQIMPGGPRESVVVASGITITLPAGMIMLPGWDIRIRDVSAVAAAADDMKVNLMFQNIARIRLAG